MEEAAWRNRKKSNDSYQCNQASHFGRSGTLSGVATRDGVIEITFLGVTDDAHVLDTVSGAVLDLRLQLEVVPNLDVKIRRA